MSDIVTGQDVMKCEPAKQKTLLVVVGPTGIGKTGVAIELAKLLHTEIISADSRQIYQDIPITTAAPTAEERAAVRHHLVDKLPLDSYYSASMFEQDALAILDDIFSRSDYAVLCGGSMMYVDALCYGIDDIPTISSDVRERVDKLREEYGIGHLLEELKRLDPEYYDIVDHNNVKRVAHALEICFESGTTYTSLRKGTSTVCRPFSIVKIGLNCDRQVLFQRINARVEKMLESGMIDEARSVYDKRHLNSLNTVGFKEMFRYLDGEWDCETAVARMQKNTRVYAKKQLTWFSRQHDIRWFDPTLYKTHKELAEDILRVIG